jgi:PKHD-type hydroxylase
MMVKLDNFLSDRQVQDIFNLITSGEIQPRSGKDSAGAEIKFKKNSTVYDDTINKRLHGIIFTPKNIDIVSSKVTSGEFINISSAVAVYNVGDFYDWHLDALTKGDGRSVKISYTIWLSNPSEYEGGELTIKHEYGETVLKESSSYAVFYPHGLLHKVSNVTKGKRIVIVGFMDCLVPSSHDRYILSELESCLSILYSISDNMENDDELKAKIEDLCIRISFLEMQLSKKFIKS